MAIPKRQLLELFNSIPFAESELYREEMSAFLETFIQFIDADNEVEHQFTRTGTETLVSGTKAVTFTETLPTTSYSITLSGDENETFRWASKAVTGFTINSSNGSSTSDVDWIVRIHDTE